MYNYYPHMILHENGMISSMYASWPQSEREQREILGKALCIGTASLARAYNVPENEIRECKVGSIAAIEHNLKKVNEKLNDRPNVIAKEMNLK